MAEHIVKILGTEFITPDVKRFTVEKPTGFRFTPGQGTNVSINTPDLVGRLRLLHPASLED